MELIIYQIIIIFFFEIHEWIKSSVFKVSQKVFGSSKTEHMAFNLSYTSGTRILSVNTMYTGISKWELHCLLFNFKSSTCDPFKYKMGSPILIVSIYMRKYT